ncbi:fluoride efflux transporter CrcB [Aquibium carbonis]|uniref:Fluoride-specific ion channel FluC n=1 Tax=Aquibium carbonis TaxID=2495581 RepID=A0A429YZ37_9HYPH|nr:fluoride efflux transporter CrcB [Aquibium carbonis]RST86721.1 fluoride efflux transporter CrcB [Aquibium carbonis]
MSRTARLYGAVALGSALGALARYLCSLGLLAVFGAGFPVGTLAVNVAGSFLIGLFATLTEPGGRLLASPPARQFVLAGFCGGFTTFSVFSLETLFLLESRAFHLAALNLGVSVILWLAAVWLGWRIGARLNRLKGS